MASVDESQHGAAFLQRRLRMMYRVVTWIAWIALPTHLLVVLTAPATRTEHPIFTAGCFVALAVTGALLLWLVRSSRPRDLPTLQRIETISALTLALLFAATVVVPTGRIDEVYVSVAMAGFAVLGRTLLIPSTWRRTLWLAVACMAPTFAGVVVVAASFPERLTFHAAGLVVTSVFLCGFPVLLATVSTWVITGLRERVREARRLGQYTLGDKIGEGGMGAVYKAQHALLRRPTAIKLLRADRSGEDAIRRFEREVQLTAELTDPHVVAIFDYGRSPDGIFYYAMEYLDGIDLETLVRDFGPQPPGRVVAILRQVCHALDEAHGRGLIHRDIKPANIILCERGRRADAVKVVDFGLVKELAAAADAGETLAGTPAYLSPEAINEPAAVGPASDLYAVGAVAYFLLTGVIVFEARTIDEMCDHHTSTAPTPPSARTARPIPAALEALVLACLAKDPAARPASAAALGATLDGLAAIAAWTAADADRWWRSFRARPPGATPAVDPVAQTLAVAERA